MFLSQEHMPPTSAACPWPCRDVTQPFPPAPPITCLHRAPLLLCVPEALPGATGSVHVSLCLSRPPKTPPAPSPPDFPCFSLLSAFPALPPHSCSVSRNALLHPVLFLDRKIQIHFMLIMSLMVGWDWFTNLQEHRGKKFLKRNS